MSEHENETRAVFIVEDHAVMREMLAEFINLAPDLTVCGEVGSAAEALEAVLPSKPDVVLVDVSLPDASGIELVRRLRARQPDLRCLIVSGHADRLYVEDAEAAGARGYVMKGDPLAILEAVRQVLRGERAFKHVP